MKRRNFLQTTATVLAVGVTKPTAAFTPPSFELEELTIPDLQRGMQSGKYSARSLVEKYTDRINDIDKKGPTLKSVIELNPDAEAIAAALDRERKDRGPRGPLHGIPILIKDNIDTHDRMMTTAGSLAMLGAKPFQDASVAKKLRDAGAVILGKTNLSEWANFRSTKSTSGWSARGGQTKNPYVLDRNPCGSSSGSGVAPSANLCAAAIGTETDGSIVCPSSANSLVGIKPTVGLVSRAGIIPISHSQDTAGPMARTVTDAAIILGALTGEDPRDKTTTQSRGKAHTDYTRFLDKNGLNGMRIGVAKKHLGFNRYVDALMAEVILTITGLGARVFNPADIPTTGQFDDSEFDVLLYEFKADLNAYLKGLGASTPIRSLKELIAFNESKAEFEMPFFGQDIFEKAEAKGPLTEPKYLQALRKNHMLTRTRGIDFIMKDLRLDGLIAPTGGPPWRTDWLNGDHLCGGYSSAAGVAGYAHITVPAGYVYGLPVGVSFFGGANSEPTLIKAAYAFEQATKARRPPKFLPTVDFSRDD